jgi:hypothetical protein
MKCFSHMSKNKFFFSLDKEPLHSSRIEQRDVKNMTTNESIASKKVSQNRDYLNEYCLFF